MLKVILNRLKPQAEEIIVLKNRPGSEPEEASQNKFSTSESCQKCLQHQQNLYHVLNDIKKAFEKVWQSYGQQCGSIIYEAMQIKFPTLGSFTTRLKMEFR